MPIAPEQSQRFAGSFDDIDPSGAAGISSSGNFPSGADTVMGAATPPALSSGSVDIVPGSQSATGELADDEEDPVQGPRSGLPRSGS